MTIMAGILGHLGVDLDGELDAREDRIKRDREFAKMQRRALLLSYPVHAFTKENFSALPWSPAEKFLQTCPLGTWFKCVQEDHFDDIYIVGQVVAGKDLLPGQRKHGQQIPRRGVNIYRVEVV